MNNESHHNIRPDELLSIEKINNVLCSEDIKIANDYTDNIININSTEEIYDQVKVYIFIYT